MQLYAAVMLRCCPAVHMLLSRHWTFNPSIFVVDLELQCLQKHKRSFCSSLFRETQYHSSLLGVLVFDARQMG